MASNQCNVLKVINCKEKHNKPVFRVFYVRFMLSMCNIWCIVSHFAYTWGKVKLLRHSDVKCGFGRFLMSVRGEKCLKFIRNDSFGLWIARPDPWIEETEESQSLLQVREGTCMEAPVMTWGMSSIIRSPGPESRKSRIWP